jgi:glycogen synthase
MALHVLLTTDVVGGVWDFATSLADGLVSRERAQVTLLALGDPSTQQRAHARSIGVDLVAEPLRLEWMQDSAVDVLATQALVERLVHDLRPDVVHANQFAAVCASTCLEVPVLLTLHSDVLSWRRWTLASSEVPPEWQAYSALVRAALAQADRVVAVSHFLAREVAELYDCARAIDVIHNGWPSAPLAPAERRGTLLAGRIWDDAKNIRLAAEAARGWDPGDVLLAGEHRHPDGGQAGVPPPLRALGFVPLATLLERLRRTRVYLSPARYDPFGLLPLQAAVSGCALLLSDIPSYRELWDGAAAFFDPTNAEDLRNTWQSLLSAPERVTALAHGARSRALEQYAPQRMLDAYSSTYAALRTTARV